MKTRIARYMLTAIGFAGLAGAPALFAGDLGYDRYDVHRDYNRLERQDADIRADRYRLHDDREDTRFRAAARIRADLNRDYRERNRQIRDIDRDRRDIRQDEYDRYRGR
jgi:hypothetical protein